MGVLTELGIDTERGTAVLIAPSDDVLAEASRMKPRPAVRSFMHAIPASWFIWWPARDELDDGHIERLHWFLSAVQDGEGWLVVDPDDAEDSMTEEELAAALTGSQLEPVGDSRALSSGERAQRIRPILA